MEYFYKVYKEEILDFMEKHFLSHIDEIILASPFIINSDYTCQGLSPTLLENFPLKNLLKILRNQRRGIQLFITVILDRREEL